MSLIPPFIYRRIANRPNLLRILDNIGWLFFDKLLRIGLSLFVGVWIARYLEPEQFGIYSFAIAFVGLFSVVATFGIQSIVVRDLVRSPEKQREILGTAFCLQLVGGFLVYGAMLGAILWLRPDDSLIKLLVAILGSAVLFKASEVSIYWFESQVRSKYIVWVGSSVFLFFSLVKILLILLDLGITAFAWASLLEAAATAMLTLFVLNIKGMKLRGLHVNYSRIRGMLSNSWPLMLSGIAITIYMRIDQIMLGQIVGNASVGVYSAALRLVEAWYFIPTIVVASVFPAIINAKDRDEALYYRQLQNLYILLFWTALASSAVLYFFSDLIVKLLFGDSYAGASVVFSIYVWNTIFVALGVARGKWLVAENLQMYGFAYIFISMIVNVLLNSLLIPEYEGVGAAWATIVSTLVATVIAPALFSKTRVSSVMLFRSMLPIPVGSSFNANYWKL